MFLIVAAYFAVLPAILFFLDGNMQQVLLYLHALCVPLLFQLSFQDGMYKLRHVVFNLELPPKTLWFNMGLWDNDTVKSYGDACRRLVSEVVSRMRLLSRNGQHVLGTA